MNCRFFQTVRVAEYYVLLLLIPAALAAGAVGAMVCESEIERAHEAEETVKVWGKVEAKERYNAIRREGKHDVQETLYRMMIIPVRQDEAHPMKQHITVDNVAWDTWARKKEGDLVCFKLWKSEVFPNHEEQNGWYNTKLITMFVIIASLTAAAIVILVGALVTDLGEKARRVRDGMSPLRAVLSFDD